MSKLGVTPQNYEIEVPGYEGKIRLRRLTLGELRSIRDETDDERKTLLIVASVALNRSNDLAYSKNSIEEVKELPLSLIKGIAEAALAEAKGTSKTGN